MKDSPAQVNVLEIGWSGNLLVDISLASSGFNASLFCFGNLCDVAVHGIL